MNTIRWAILGLLFLLVSLGHTAAAQTPYATVTLGPSRTLFPTQDAYVPLDEVRLSVASPEDMFFAPDGFLYVADTGNKRILKLDAQFQIVAELGQDILQAPTGLFVDEDSTLYITDASKNTVVILDSAGQLINEFGRPTEPLFGANREFRPRKIAVDARKNMYIVSEGSVNGLVIMNTNGNFIGYFGANAADMSLKMILQRTFLTAEQLEQFIRNEAASPSNVTIDARSLVYTVTSGTERDKSVRKFNISGKNLFDKAVYGSPSFRDIDVSADGLFVAVDAIGRIFEYDQNGTLIFIFGALERGDQRLGLLNNPTAIERVGDYLYVLDKGKNAIVVYQITDFARELHKGISLYVEGFYAEARPYFKEVLNYNGLMLIAYKALADADYKENNYANALAFYRYAEDRNGYSEAFWELRNAGIQQHLSTVLAGVFVLWFGSGVFNRLERRYKWLDPLRQLGRRARKIRLLDDFVFMFRFIRRPADSFYYIKNDMRGSIGFALILYGWVLAVSLIAIYWTGFVFSPYYSTSWQVQAEMEIVYVVLPIVLWIAANYLISSITDGEGRLRHIVIGSAYSLFPIALFSLPITLLSNVLTLNEVFIFTFSHQLVTAWVALMFFIMVREIHNYSLSETIRNILTTFFTMAIFLLIGYILYVLFNQMYEFVYAIIQEASLRG